MSAGQQRAFDPGPATGGLRDNQQFVLELLQRHPGGMLAIDVGRELHMVYGDCSYCSDNRLCKFAKGNAIAILESLGVNRRELVARTRQGYWYSKYGVDDGRYDPAQADFPPGY